MRIKHRYIGENTETDISSDISVITTKAMLDGLLEGEAGILQQHA